MPSVEIDASVGVNDNAGKQSESTEYNPVNEKMPSQTSNSGVEEYASGNSITCTKKSEQHQTSQTFQTPNLLGKK